MIDIVWYTPEQKPRALGLVTSLPQDQIQARGLKLSLCGLGFAFGVPLPAQARAENANAGTVAWTNHLGTLPIVDGEAGAFNYGRKDFADNHVDIVESGPGFAAGTWKLDVRAGSAWIKRAELQGRHEDRNRLNRAEGAAAELASEDAALLACVVKLDAVAELMGKKKRMKRKAWNAILGQGLDVEALQAFLSRVRGTSPAGTTDPEAAALAGRAAVNRPGR